VTFALFGLLLLVALIASADEHIDAPGDSQIRVPRQGLLGSIAEGVAEGLVEGLIIGNRYPNYYGKIIFRIFSKNRINLFYYG